MNVISKRGYLKINLYSHAELVKACLPAECVAELISMSH